MSVESSKLVRRVLVAVDDPTTRQMIAVIIEKEGYGVVAAQDGREAYKILQKDGDFSAAIFDMVMPHLQGLDLIRHMQTEKRLKRIPVMLIMTEQNLQPMSNIFAVGTAIFLPKTFTAPQLQIMLKTLINKSRDEANNHRR